MGGDHSSGGPGGLAPRVTALDQGDAQATAAKLPGAGQANDATADDGDISGPSATHRTYGRL